MMHIIKGQKQKFENEVLYEDHGIRVSKNSCDEILVKNTESGLTMRLSARRNGLGLTTEGRVEPFPIHNKIGWQISPR